MIMLQEKIVSIGFGAIYCFRYPLDFRTYSLQMRELYIQAKVMSRLFCIWNTSINKIIMNIMKYHKFHTFYIWVTFEAIYIYVHTCLIFSRSMWLVVSSPFYQLGHKFSNKSNLAQIHIKFPLMYVSYKGLSLWPCFSIFWPPSHYSNQQEAPTLEV